MGNAAFISTPSSWVPNPDILRFRDDHWQDVRGVGLTSLRFGELKDMNLSQKKSKCPWRRCEPAQNAHILRVCSAFSPSRVLPGTLIFILR